MHCLFCLLFYFFAIYLYILREKIPQKYLDFYKHSNLQMYFKKERKTLQLQVPQYITNIMEGFKSYHYHRKEDNQYKIEV